jgi:hypothetical protein
MSCLEFKINYKDYPEFMFAIIASYLGDSPEAAEIRKCAGNLVFRHEKQGRSYKNGLLHSFDDKPKKNIKTGALYWYKDGLIHRDGDRPAYISKEYHIWYKNGKFHREGDLPAVIKDSYLCWYKNGVIDREGDLPAVMDGKVQIWYKNGEIHRQGDLPAIIDTQLDKKSWCKNGIYHRENGLPAIISPDCKVWFIHGKLYWSTNKSIFSNLFSYFKFKLQSCIDGK